MKLEVIYTFENAPQQILQIPISKTIVNNREMFFVNATASLTNEEKQTLVKMSCCICDAADIRLYKKHWYNQCNGKFWDNEIPGLMKQLYNIECTYEPINQ